MGEQLALFKVFETETRPVQEPIVEPNNEPIIGQISMDELLKEIRV